MLLRQLADSFPATFVVLCALAYGNFATSVAWGRLYLAQGRQFIALEAVDENPVWSKNVRERRYWMWQLLILFALLAVLAGLIAVYTYVAAHLPATDQELALAARDWALALYLGAYLAMIAGNLRSIAAIAFMREGWVSGQSVQKEQYTYALTATQYLVMSVPLFGLAVLNPTPLTIGFAAGPLFVAARVRIMGRRQARA
jgi:MFS family permease